MNRKSPPYRIGLVYGPRLDVGGVETHLLQLLKYLDLKRFNPLIFSSASDRFTNQVNALGSQVIPWKIKHAIDFRSAQQLKKLLREYKIDMVHIHHPRAYWPASQAARALELPSLATVHVPAREMASAPAPLLSTKEWAYATIEDWLLRRRIDRVVFVSERVRARTNPIPHAFTIPNGIELGRKLQPETRDILRSSLHIPKNSVVLIAVGRLHPQKGFDILIKALALLKPTPGTLQLWIVGEGQERSVLEQQTFSLNLQDTVRFLGAREDIPDLLQAADIFLLPSRFEGMPYVLLEAMAAGMAVISTDVGEVGNIIEENKTGFLVPAEDATRLAERIKTLWQSPQLRTELRTAAIARVSDFELEPLVQRLAAVYNALFVSCSTKDEGAQDG